MAQSVTERSTMPLAHSGPDGIASPQTSSPQASPAPAGERLLSLDVLRGFTMFWITGGREFALATVACLISPTGQTYDAVYTQLTHPRWNGFVVWDMVMPIFLFVVGTTLPLSLGKRVGQGQPLRPVYFRIVRRVAVLWACGMIIQYVRYWKYWSQPPVVPEMYSNALQAIAIGYLVTSIALLHFSVRGQVALFVALLLGYWALLTFVPFGGYPAGTLLRNANFARYIDEKVLDVWRRDHDFTWVVSSLGFAASVLLGSFAGRILGGRFSLARKLLWLSSLGIGCLAAGWLWSYWLPLNRHLWTSSMVLWAGGWGFLLVAVLHVVVDVAKIRKWAFPFVVIGANALVAYVLDPFVDKATDFLASSLLHAPTTRFGDPSGSYYVTLLSAILEIGVLWLILWYLYRKRTLLRA